MVFNVNWSKLKFFTFRKKKKISEHIILIEFKKSVEKKTVEKNLICDHFMKNIN